MNFIVWKTFDREELMIPTLLILIGVPAFLSLFFRRFYLKGRKKFPDLSDKKKNNVKLLNFEMLDSCLADSFESIVKVGLYIIFFFHSDRPAGEIISRSSAACRDPPHIGNDKWHSYDP